MTSVRRRTPSSSSSLEPARAAVPESSFHERKSATEDDIAQPPRSAAQTLRHRFLPPGVPRPCFERPRLDRLMTELFDTYSVVEMIAATGAGKTVQAHRYSSASHRQIAWLTIDHHDRSAAGLVFDLATALTPVVADAVDIVRHTLQGEGTADEAAAILAGAAADHDCLFVIDECQRIARSETATTLDTFLEYVPERMRVLLLSQEELPWPIQKRYVHGQIAQITDAALNLTPEETAEYIDQSNGGVELSDQIYSSTGGWMAGVALATRFGLESGPTFQNLSAYFDTQVFQALPADEQDFLLDTSVADVIAKDTAVALCGPDGHRLLTAIAARHLPATSTTGSAVTCHALFRSFLTAKLLEQRPERHTELMQTYGGHLASTRQHQEAAEIFLSVGDLPAAMESATLALPTLFNRADWPVVDRWLEAFGEDHVLSNPALLGARIRAGHGLRDFERTGALIRRLDREGRLRAVVEADPSLLATAAWELQSRPQEALSLLDKYIGDHRAHVVRYMIQTSIGTRPAMPPLVQDFADVERLMSWGLFVQGRLGDLARLTPTSNDRSVLNPNVILAAAFRGNVDDARDLWSRVPPEVRGRAQSRFIEAMCELLAGNHAPAHDALRQAQAESRHSGFWLGPVYEIFLAYLAVVDDRPQVAIDQLQPVLEEMSRTGQTAYAEWAQCFLGVACLRALRNEEARLFLHEAVVSMTRSHRRLLLPMAAAALSEAEARAADHDAAHHSAEVALKSAVMTGNYSFLIQAVRLFPDVRRREMSAHPEDSGWRRLVVSPSVRPIAQVRKPNDADLALRIQPFGRDRDLYVDGVAAHIGRIKILELVAALTLQPHGVSRTQLQQRLFPEADQRNGGNHFRQIAHKFRHSTGVMLERRGDLVSFPSSLVLIADDIESERLLAAANSSSGEERLEKLRAALSLATGTYLEGSTLSWVEERRNYLAMIYEEGRLGTAALYLQLGRPDAARGECEAVLAQNRYSDPGYRLLVEIERRVGSESSALAAYRRAVDALRELGLRPGDARRLLQQSPV
jgi:LuxR family maltose regulon positive regulatory protein